jgi:hypothetical protein
MAQYYMTSGGARRTSVFLPHKKPMQPRSPQRRSQLCITAEELTATEDWMSDTESQLFANLLDALDRLYDRKCTEVELWALLFATAAALDGHHLAPVVDAARVRVEAVLRSGASNDESNAECLFATDDLRHVLANLDD